MWLSALDELLPGFRIAILSELHVPISEDTTHLVELYEKHKQAYKEKRQTQEYTLNKSKKKLEKKMKNRNNILYKNAMYQNEIQMWENMEEESCTPPGGRKQNNNTIIPEKTNDVLELQEPDTDLNIDCGDLDIEMERYSRETRKGKSIWKEIHEVDARIEKEKTRKTKQQIKDNNNKRHKISNTNNTKILKKQVEYEIEDILEERINLKNKQYLVKWVGYDDTHNSWVKEKDLHAPKLLKEWGKKYLTKKIENIIN